MTQVIAYVDGSFFDRFDTMGSGVFFSEHVNISVEEYVSEKLGPLSALTAEIYAVALALKQAVRFGFKSITIKQDCKVSIDFCTWIQKHANLSWVDVMAIVQQDSNTIKSYRNSGMIHIADLFHTYEIISRRIWHCLQFVEMKIEYVPSHAEKRPTMEASISDDDYFGNSKADEMARQAAILSRSPKERAWMDEISPFNLSRFPFPVPTPKMCRRDSWMHACAVALSSCVLVNLINTLGVDLKQSLADSKVEQGLLQRPAEYFIFQCLDMARKDREKLFLTMNKDQISRLWNTLGSRWRMLLIFFQDSKKTLFPGI